MKTSNEANLPIFCGCWLCCHDSLTWLVKSWVTRSRRNKGHPTSRDNFSPYEHTVKLTWDNPLARGNFSPCKQALNRKELSKSCDFEAYNTFRSFFLVQFCAAIRFLRVLRPVLCFDRYFLLLLFCVFAIVFYASHGATDHWYTKQVISSTIFHLHTFQTFLTSFSRPIDSH